MLRVTADTRFLVSEFGAAAGGQIARLAGPDRATAVTRLAGALDDLAGLAHRVRRDLGDRLDVVLDPLADHRSLLRRRCAQSSPRRSAPSSSAREVSLRSTPERPSAARSCPPSWASNTGSSPAGANPASANQAGFDPAGLTLLHMPVTTPEQVRAFMAAVAELPPGALAAARKRYDPDARLTDLYDKVVRRR